MRPCNRFLKRRSLCGFLVSLHLAMLAMACSMTIVAQEAGQQAARELIPKVNDGDLNLRSAADLVQDPLGPKLGNGSVAVAGDWPASGISDSDCSATLIGTQVAITAAHCVGNGAKLKIQNSDGSHFSGVCHRHKNWSRDSNVSPDVALCLMQTMTKTGLFFESLLLELAPLAKGQKLLLGGYGCLDLETEERDTPPKFRIGNVFVDAEVGHLSGWPNWLRTEQATSASISFVCRGDSGGSVYYSPVGERRAIVAIISAVDANKSKPTYKASYLVALATPEIQQFIHAWPISSCDISTGQPKNCMTEDGAPPKICGVNSGAIKCRPLPD